MDAEQTVVAKKVRRAPIRATPDRPAIPVAQPAEKPEALCPPKDLTTRQPARQSILVRETVMNATQTRPSETIIVAADLRRAARLATLESEVALLAEVSSSRKAPQLPRWWNARFQGQAPSAIVRRNRAARYRMPRKLKQRLIEPFCTVADPAAAQTPSVMIVVAHQDDESIGAGSRLCKMTDTLVVHVTDGAPRDPSVAQRYGFATREEYAEARRRELLAAMNVAGVSHERLVSLDYVDGEASLKLVDLVLDITQLIDDFAPDIVLTHPYEGGHTDHDATAFAVHLACGLLRREGVEPPAVLEFTSYHSADGERVTHDFIPHDGADKDQRLLLLARQPELPAIAEA